MKKRVFALLLSVFLALGMMLQFPVTAAATSNIPRAIVSRLDTSVPVQGATANDLLITHKYDVWEFAKGNLDDVLPFWPLTFGMCFQADDTNIDTNDYRKWYADFELMVTEDVCGNEGYLAGQYSTISKYWVIIEDSQNPGPVLHAGQPINVMAAFDMPMHVDEIYSTVQTFNCGLFLTEAFWNDHPDAKVWLSLKIYENYVGGGYSGRSETIAYPLAFVNPYAEAPETGDTTHILMWTGLFACGAVMTWIQLQARKREMY